MQSTFCAVSPQRTRINLYFTQGVHLPEQRRAARLRQDAHRKGDRIQFNKAARRKNRDRDA